MVSIDILFNAFITLLVVIDPVGVAAAFAALSKEWGAAERRRTALRGVLIAAGILLAFALGGNQFLRALGIGLEAFRIAGGVLLFYLAIDMILARPSGRTTPVESEEAGGREDISVFPLAIPLISGPGAITSVVLLMGPAWASPQLAVSLLGVVALVLLITFLALIAAARLLRLLGVTGANVVGRVLGILLAALAVQFILDGLQGAGVLR